MEGLWPNLDNLVEYLGTVTRTDAIWTQNTASPESLLMFDGYRITTEKYGTPHAHVSLLPINFRPGYDEFISGASPDAEGYESYRVLVEPLGQPRPISHMFTWRFEAGKFRLHYNPDRAVLGDGQISALMNYVMSHTTIFSGAKND